jgi:hypothetical protein
MYSPTYVHWLCWFIWYILGFVTTHPHPGTSFLSIYTVIFLCAARFRRGTPPNTTPPISRSLGVHHGVGSTIDNSRGSPHAAGNVVPTESTVNVTHEQEPRL